MVEKEANKPFNVRFKPSYMEKVEVIVEETGLAKSKVMNEILGSYFEGKVLTNDFIVLEKPFYFNMNELKRKKTVKAVEKIPTYKRNEGFLVVKVPNNLDSFNKELKTFCSGTATNHKGIYINFDVRAVKEGTDNIFSHVVKDISEDYLIFEYDSSAKTLEISLVPFEDLYLYVPEDSTILERLEAEKDEFYNNIILDEETNLLNEIELILKTTEVLRSYKTVKDIQIYKKSKKFKETLKLMEELEAEEKKLGVNYDSEKQLSGSEFKQKYKELKEFEEQHEKLIEEYESKHNG